MSDRNQESRKNPLRDDHTGKGHGPEGVDKAPGEETAGDLENFVAETQKGQAKQDGDPSLENDQPMEQGRH